MAVKWGDLPHTMNVVECSIPEGMTIAEYRAHRAELNGEPDHVVRGWLAAHQLTMVNDALNVVLRAAAIR